MKYFKLVFLVIFIAAAYLILFCGDPPIREDVVVKPQDYLRANQYVKGLRKEFAEDGRIAADFLPSQINAEQTVEYLYWYHCAVFGDPNYAITVTIRFPTDEALMNEMYRIKETEGFTEIVSDDFIIIGCKNLAEKLEDFFEPPVRDGSRYTMEYAIISTEDRTITYSEVCIWENQRIQEKIDSQLHMVYENTQSKD